MLLFSNKQTNKQTTKQNKDSCICICTFLAGSLVLVGSSLTPSLGAECSGNLKPCGVDFGSGKLELSSL